MYNPPHPPHAPLNIHILGELYVHDYSLFARLDFNNFYTAQLESLSAERSMMESGLPSSTSTSSSASSSVSSQPQGTEGARGAKGKHKHQQGAPPSGRKH